MARSHRDVGIFSTLVAALTLAACSDTRPGADMTRADEATASHERVTLAMTPEEVGCSDATREGFTDEALYPAIASCGGAWTVPGIFHDDPVCDRAAGNNGANAAGTGCNVEDLCAVGWHVCYGRQDVDSRTHGDGCRDSVAANYRNDGSPPYGRDADGSTISPPPGGAFFASKTSGSGSGNCQDVVNGNPSGFNDVFGCGNMGSPPQASCAPLNQFSHDRCGGLQNLQYGGINAFNPATDYGYDSSAWAWSCGTQGANEARNIVKTTPQNQGGVMCCKDTHVSLPEICDGIDNDDDGQVDETDFDNDGSEDDVVGGPCTPPGGGCGTLACTGGGGWTCQPTAGGGSSTDATCDGVDDDCDGVTDDDYAPVATSCGQGGCAATGMTSCSNGVVTDDCTPGTPAADDASCDGVDNDCNGVTDDGFVGQPTTCGVGECAATGTSSCVDGVLDPNCDPGAAGPDDTSCDGKDNDCDGQTDNGYQPVQTSCGVGGCAVTAMSSCDDGVVSDNCDPGTPAASDPSCDGVDDDCDGITDEDYMPRNTTCGQGACASTGVTSCANGVEQDSCTGGTPGSGDATCDGVDDDCDGETDEDYPSVATSCGVGACAATGATSCVAGVVQDSCRAGTPAADDAGCDGVDNDCNGVADEDYVSRPTSCGQGACSATGATSCVNGTEQDSCTPGTPGGGDATCDGNDDDCDGSTDEDYTSQTTTCGVGACAGTGATSCVGGSVVDSCTPGTPGSGDATCDGVDDDCDGAEDEDYASLPTTCGEGACGSTGSTSCVAGSVEDSCTPGTPGSGDATCDGNDDDCDGSVDEDYVPQETSCGVGACADTGATSCVAGSVEDSCTPGTPAAEDTGCDGVDDDCDGNIDDGYVSQPTTCGEGACGATGATSCVDGGVVDSCTPGTPGSGDATCDGVDDDCDAQIDEDYVPLDTQCGVGACVAMGATSCVDGSVEDSCVAGTPAADDATCDGVDDDCDGTADDDFSGEPTSCGVGACASTGSTFCSGGTVMDSCTEGTPALADTTCDGVDDDCDGVVDDDYAPIVTRCGVGVCAQTGMSSCVAGRVEDDCAPISPPPSVDDVTCDGADDDCDGQNDEDFQGAMTACGVGECARQGEMVCVGGVQVDNCEAGPAAAVDGICDGLDEDCDGQTDEDHERRQSRCGEGACAARGYIRCTDGVEEDSCRPHAISTVDTTCDGRDDDCDGVTDEDFRPEETTCGQGVCRATGVTSCDNGRLRDSCTPGPKGSSFDFNCDGLDNDCDGFTDEAYIERTTRCGEGRCAGTGRMVCRGGTEIDTCGPPDGTPRTDVTCDNFDDDCDGVADDDFPTGPSSCGNGGCAREGLVSCVAGRVVDSCVPGLPASDDAQCDGVDADCDGATDEDFVPGPTQCGLGACASTGSSSCVAGALVDTCVEVPASTDVDARCDGVDEDCDGATDEDFPGATTCGVGACATEASARCIAGALVTDCQPGEPAQSDAACDGVDEDCDGRVDEDFVQTPTTCGFGFCTRRGLTTCVGGALGDSCRPGTPPTDTDDECDGLDQDCDGVADEDFRGADVLCGKGACETVGFIGCADGAQVPVCEPGEPTEEPFADRCDGVDGDCDGKTDEDHVAIPTTCGDGVCGGTGTLMCLDGTQVDTCVPRGPIAGVGGADGDTTCDGVDDDCDGETDEDFAGTVTCGVGACERVAVALCVGGVVVDDGCTAGSPGGPDDDCDGVDEDCDGEVDEDFGGAATSCGVGACAATGQVVCVDGAPADTCVPGEAGSSDASCDRVDDDCDGRTDEDFVRVPTTCGQGACLGQGQLLCIQGLVLDNCTPLSATAGECGTSSCVDGAANGQESGVDCGGGVCPERCGPGDPCREPSDCRSGMCVDGVCHPVRPCDDAARNGQETDVDCGGPHCPPCGEGGACAEDLDCGGLLTCVEGICGDDGDRDGDGIPNDRELEIGTDPDDADTDGDGLEDGEEIAGGDDALGYEPGVDLNPLDIDTDDDGLSDGDEVKGTGPLGHTTGPLDADSDDDGLQDGLEQGVDAPIPDGTSDNGVPIFGTDTSVFTPDSDPSSTTHPVDDDTDDDGLMDGDEDVNRDGATVYILGGSNSSGSGETDPNDADTDGDGLQDGQERGLSTPQGSGTDLRVFVPDADPSTTTDPLDRDTDDGGVADGVEDANLNGRLDPGEIDPAVTQDDGAQHQAFGLEGGGGCAAGGGTWTLLALLAAFAGLALLARLRRRDGSRDLPAG